jgi:hypothetical protein
VHLFADIPLTATAALLLHNFISLAISVQAPGSIQYLVSYCLHFVFLAPRASLQGWGSWKEGPAGGCQATGYWDEGLQEVLWSCIWYVTYLRDPTYVINHSSSHFLHQIYCNIKLILFIAVGSSELI